jgi:glycosyltransferase involved in cell wall biosynthesis
MRITRRDVTVIVPTKNEIVNIGRFLASIPDDIALVVVDSSDDGTPDVIAELRPSAEVVRARTNIPIARQIGSDAAVTPWLLFADADVVFAPSYFTRLEELDVGDDTGGVVGTKSTSDGFDRYHRWFVRGQRLLSWLGIPAASGSNMLVRADALDAVGGFDPALSVNEDTELMFRIARSRFSVAFARDLTVLSFDHRRLEAGLARKIAHGAIRNTALYFGLFGDTVRRSDWGYWRQAPAVVPNDQATS